MVIQNYSEGQKRVVIAGSDVLWGKGGQIFVVDMKEKGRYTTNRNVISEDLIP